MLTVNWENRVTAMMLSNVVGRFKYDATRKCLHPGGSNKNLIKFDHFRGCGYECNESV